MCLTAFKAKERTILSGILLTEGSSRYDCEIISMEAQITKHLSAVKSSVLQKIGGKKVFPELEAQSADIEYEATKTYKHVLTRIETQKIVSAVLRSTQGMILMIL